MKSLKRRLNYSRRPSSANVTISPSASAHPWEEDRERVLSVGASFSVKYLASKEVSQPRGVHVCEGAVRSTPYRRGKKKMTLTISKGGIRIVDDSTKMLAVDQPINKVSFCSPDAHNPRIFSYIAREGATRRWICHIFVAVKGITGERLSHALGCAFAACLNDKRKEEEKKGKPLDSCTTVQLENMLKDAVPPTEQQHNWEWLRKQHQIRKQMSSSPSPPHSSASSSPVFQSRTVEGWQEKAETISFEEELDSMLQITSPQQGPHSVSFSPPISLDSASYKFDLSAVGSSQLKNDSSVHPLSSVRRNAPVDASLTQKTSLKRRSLNDPWQSAPKTSVTDIPDGNAQLTSSPMNDSAWVNFRQPSLPTHRESGSHVILDPWSSKVNRVNVASELPSTNPFASDVSEADIVQSVTTNLQGEPVDANLFDPLKFNWTKDVNSVSGEQDPSDLFGNWDTAVRQMHQMPSYTHNTWSQQNQTVSNGQTFTKPSLI